MKVFYSLICRIFFIGAFLFLACAISEKFAQYLGKSVFKYPPSQLLGFSVVSLLFVITLELRDIKESLESAKIDKKGFLLSKNNKATSKVATFCAVIIVITLLVA